MAKIAKPLKGVTRPQRIAGLAVHVLTACGAVFGFLALLAALEDRFPLMFAWLALALAVDAVDGTLARRASVSRTAPEFSGETLDLVVDYLTYVFVPAFAMYRAGLLPDGLALAATFVILVTSALYFADTRMKTDDWHFRGFPAAWNLFVFLAFVFEPDPWLLAGLVALFAMLTFVPLNFVHPMRVQRFRIVSLGMLAASAALCAVALWWSLEPPFFVHIGLAVTAAYFLLVGMAPPPKRR